MSSRSFPERPRRRAPFGALVALLVATAEASAWAQPADARPEMETARRSYAEAEAAYKLGNYGDAARNFEAAYRIIKFPTMLFDVAQAYRRWYEQDKDLEKLRKALDTYKTFLRDAPTARQRPVAEKMVLELERILQAETRRRREELIAKAVGSEGLFLADQLISEGAVRDAGTVLDRILEAGHNPREVLIGALTRRALVAGQQRQPGVVRDLFRRALALDPSQGLPEGTDAVTVAAFDEAKRSLAGQSPLTLVHVPPGDVPKGRPVEVAAWVESDPTEATRTLVVYYRQQGGGAYSIARADKEARAVVIPQPFVDALRGGSKVEYYVVVLDARDNELGSLGNRKEPFVFAVQPDRAELVAAEAARPPAKPVYKRWWVWATVVAVALVGASVGVGVGVGTRPNDPLLIQFRSP